MAVQKQLNDTRLEIEAQTTKLLKAQEKSFANATIRYNSTLVELKSRVKVQQSIVDNNIKVIERQKSTVEAHKKTLLKAEEATQEETYKLSDILTQIETKKQAISDLQKTKSSLEVDLSTTKEAKIALDESIESLKARETAFKKAIANLDQQYSDKTAQKEKAIALLDAKVLDATQNLDKMEKQQEIIRSDLATWQKRLEAQDKNLRLREIKASQGEEKLINNSDLLNL